MVKGAMQLGFDLSSNSTSSNIRGEITKEMSFGCCCFGLERFRRNAAIRKSFYCFQSLGWYLGSTG